MSYPKLHFSLQACPQVKQPTCNAWNGALIHAILWATLWLKVDREGGFRIPSEDKENTGESGAENERPIQETQIRTILVCIIGSQKPSISELPSPVV